MTHNSRSKQNNYDEVVECLARHLRLDDPSRVRLTPHNCYSQQPKPQPIRYRGVDRLTEMLSHYNQVFCPFLNLPRYADIRLLQIIVFY